MNSNQITRLLFSLLLIPIGAVLILLQLGGSSGKLVSDVGLAFIVAGVVSAFHESVIRRFEGAEVAEAVANKVHEQLKQAPLATVGIRLLSAVRKGYSGYYHWALDVGSEEMFFAGRSVLHRIDADFRDRDMGTAESVIARRLVEGSQLKVLFLDPRSEMISRYAREEGQTHKQLLSNIATSLGICKRLAEILKTHSLPPTTCLQIQVFDEIPYFAYHRVDSDVIVGFYFSSALGHSSAAFKVMDAQTKEFFGQHFDSIMSRSGSTYVIRTHPHSYTVELNEHLLNELTAILVDILGDEPTKRLMNGSIAGEAS